ncbi:hypothetical protein [Streptomyces sp. NPDC098926]|uniref:hypothetical protein n=1 Tax=Streptomyces sp. NPDC098926 TaxID=3366099 RepID=UPI00381FFBE5
MQDVPDGDVEFVHHGDQGSFAATSGGQASEEDAEVGVLVNNNDTGASQHCSVRFASSSYREALSSRAYNGKITPAGNLFNPHVP